MAERANHQELSGNQAMGQTLFLGSADALKADLVAVDSGGIAVSALPDLVAELDDLRRSVEVAQAKALARLHWVGVRMPVTLDTAVATDPAVHCTADHDPRLGPLPG
jgi:hypothetical protein